MANPTVPFSWQMPEPADLVTDLPADFEVFGQAVATSMADLLGGTTGQVLAKASNTDMDFAWTAAAAGGLSLIGTPTTFGTVASQSISDVFSSTYDNYRIIIQHGGSSASNFVGLRFRVSGADNTSTDYRWAALGPISYESATVLLSDGGASATNCLVTFGASAYGGNSTIDIQNPFATAKTTFNGSFAATGIGASASTFGLFNATTSFTGFTISPFGGGNLTGGTITVYGYNK
jgi:hypothetical protein